MLFAIFCTDRPGRAQVRLDNRPAHVEFLKGTGDALKMAGPTLTEDGSAMTGSLIVVDCDDLSAAEAWAAGDPYAKAGLFESVVIRPFKQVFPQ
jgi:uncharacterized protein YciI